ncbi:unnamed protein product, partial [Cyprideis torosa]
NAKEPFVSPRQIIWEGPLGTVAVVGVATADMPLHCPGYVALLGSDEEGWGWNLVSNKLVHKGVACGIFPKPGNNTFRYQVIVSDNPSLTRFS